MTCELILFFLLKLQFLTLDRSPTITQLLNLPPKTPADRPFESAQLIGHVPGPLGGGVGSHAVALTDLNVLRHLARSYRAFRSEGITVEQMCKHNAEVCEAAGCVFPGLRSHRLRQALAT